MTLKRTRKNIRNLGRDIRNIWWAIKGTYRPFPENSGLSLEHLGMPRTDFDTRARPMIFTADFLPNAYSFSGVPFEDSPHVAFAREYLGNPQFNFRQTQYYKLAVRGRLPYPCAGRRQAENRCRQFIELIGSLQNDGYDPERYGAITFVQCVDNTVMILNGKHRMAAMMALGVTTVPAIMAMDNEVHAFYEGIKWRARPRSFYSRSYAVLKRVGSPRPQASSEIDALISTIKKQRLESWADVYHPIPFYEFRGLTTQVQSAVPYQRLSMVLHGYQDFAGLKVLDLGCNVGFYSFSLARRGAQVTGLDIRPEYIEVASRLARIYAINAKFEATAVTPELICSNGTGWDLALCFSVIQWIIDQQGIEYGKKVLRAISERCPAMFFDTAVNSGTSCLRSFPGDELRFVQQLLRSATSYRYVNHVGDVHPYGTDIRHVFYCHR
jgi:SAM-dependent methyltransferase